jgi:cobalt-zinc-cadmium efflux system outer membrane protein
MHTRHFLLGVAALASPLFGTAAQQIEQRTTLTIEPAISALSQPAETLTLDEALRRTLASNPSLRSAGFGLEVSDALKSQAGLFPNPELSALREGTEYGTRTQTVQVSQRLELGGKRAARVGVAEQERQLASHDLAISVTQLRADVMGAYFDALIAQERVELARASVQLAEKASNVAGKRVTAGRISPIEQSRSRVAEAGARLELAQAVSELGLSQLKLVALWGDTGPAHINLQRPVDDSPNLPSLETLQQQLDTAPQMGRAHAQFEREAAQVRLERAERIPDVTITVGKQRDDQVGRNQTVLGISVPLPLFNRNQGNLLAALRRSDKARSDLEAERIRIVQALSEAYQRAQLAQSEVASIATEILPIAQNTYEATVTGFEAGKFSFLDVLDAQRTLFQTRTQYLRALSERYRAIAGIGRYVQLKPSPRQ